MGAGGNIVQIVLGGISFLFGIIILGLSGYLTHLGNDLPEDNGQYPVGTSRFMLFVAIWTLVFTFVLPLASLTSARFISVASTGIAALTVLFLFAGWVAIAANVHDWGIKHTTEHNSTTSDPFIIPGKTTVVDQTPYRIAAADAAFGAFEWITWIGIAAIVGLGSRNGAKGRV